MVEERRRKDGFRILCLPSYSPELNPDVKAHLAEKRIPRTAAELRDTIESHLNARRENRENIKSFFRKDEGKYAISDED